MSTKSKFSAPTWALASPSGARIIVRGASVGKRDPIVSKLQERLDAIGPVATERGVVIGTKTKVSKTHIVRKQDGKVVVDTKRHRQSKTKLAAKK